MIDNKLKELLTNNLTFRKGCLRAAEFGHSLIDNGDVRSKMEQRLDTVNKLVKKSREFAQARYSYASKRRFWEALGEQHALNILVKLLKEEGLWNT